MKSLADLINELDNKTPFIAQKNTAVSQASIGWHLEHSLLALIKMISAVENSTPADYKKEFNLKRFIVLMLGKIPRGKAKAPESVIPAEEITTASLLPLIEKAKQKVEAFEKLSEDKFFTHPVFGDVQVKQSLSIPVIISKSSTTLLANSLGQAPYQFFYSSRLHLWQVFMLQ